MADTKTKSQLKAEGFKQPDPKKKPGLWEHPETGEKWAWSYESKVFLRSYDPPEGNMKNQTASTRRSLIRLASTLPKGSQERRGLLRVIQKEAWGGWGEFDYSTIDPDDYLSTRVDELPGDDFDAIEYEIQDYFKRKRREIEDLSADLREEEEAWDRHQSRMTLNDITSRGWFSTSDAKKLQKSYADDWKQEQND